ncbi:MAG TPA: alpha/beta hydrolase [Moheibacter sp.]|nr:alpha/beta hydrolase [Moheibacter sp.]
MLNYEVIGDGKPVVLLHGYLENMKMWKKLAERLSSSRKVILIDLPGHGESGNFDEIHTMELMAVKVRETLAFLKISNADFIGHSMGGYVTLAYVEKFPVDVNSFALMNSSSLPDSDEKKEQRLKAVVTAEKNLDTLIKMSVPSLFAEQNLEDLKQEIAFTKELARETSLQGVTSALKGMRLRPDRTQILNDFRGKIGIIIGKYDKAVNPEELKKIIPPRENISVLELETGHMSHLEAPEETLGFIEGFLE